MSWLWALICVKELCVDLHVNGTKVDDWHNLAMQAPSDLELKCKERLEMICQFLEVSLTDDLSKL